MVQQQEDYVSSSHEGLDLLRKSERGLKKHLLFAMFFSFFINILMLVSPLYMLQIYDRVLGSGSVETLIFLTLLAFGLMVGSGFLEALRTKLLAHSAIEFEDNLGGHVFESLVPLTSHKGLKEPLQPLKDLEGIRHFVSSQGVTTLMDVPWAPIFLLVLFLLHPLLGVIALIGAALLAVVALLTEVTTRPYHKKCSEHGMRNTYFTSSVMRNSDVVLAMGMENELKERWLPTHEKTLRSFAGASTIGGALKGVAKFLRPFLQVLILGVGAYLTLQGQITAGAIIAGSILMGRALAPIEQAIGSWRQIVQASQSYARLKDFMGDIEPFYHQRLDLPPPTGRVDVDKLIVHTPDKKNVLLKALNFSLEPGEFIALVGSSGAGKSTLLRAMAGIIVPSRGAVRYDDANVLHWPITQKGTLIGYMPQDVELFEGTIAQNIARLKKPDPQLIHEACALADIQGLINRLENGFETKLSAGGAPLSAGERQRIGLARAIYGLPSVILLDEPNAHLDYEGEQALAQCLTRLKKKGLTIMIVSHRQGLLQVVDEVLILKDGALSKKGSVQEEPKKPLIGLPIGTGSYKKPANKNEGKEKGSSSQQKAPSSKFVGAHVVEPHGEKPRLEDIDLKKQKSVHGKSFKKGKG